MKKTLVTYFSASGVTRKAAQTLAQTVSADIYEIRPEVLYTESDLNWMNKQSRSSIEMSDLSSRPALADTSADIAAYDTILVGFPIWWYVAPTLINTFLESYDFAGKTVILFATSGGSGWGKTAEKLAGSVDASTVLKEGKVFRGHVSDEDVAVWGTTLAL